MNMMITSAVKNMNAPKRDNLKVHTSSNVFSLKNESLYLERIFFQKMRDLFFLCILRLSEVYTLQYYKLIMTITKTMIL